MLFNLELILNNASQSVEHGKARSIGIEVCGSHAEFDRQPWKGTGRSRGMPPPGPRRTKSNRGAGAMNERKVMSYTIEWEDWYAEIHRARDSGLRLSRTG